MSVNMSAKRSSLGTSNYEGYATIRGHSLMRSLSIRAKELDAAAAAAVDNADQQGNQKVGDLTATRTSTLPNFLIQRKRTFSLCAETKNSIGSIKDNKSSQCLYHQPSQLQSKDKLFATLSAEQVLGNHHPSIIPLANNYQGNSEGFSHIADILQDYPCLRKTSRFSLESLFSNNTAKTTDSTIDEEQIYLYTAPESPIRNDWDPATFSFNGPTYNSSLNKNSFYKFDCSIGSQRTSSEYSRSSNSSAKSRRPSTSPTLSSNLTSQLKTGVMINQKSGLSLAPPLAKCDSDLSLNDTPLSVSPGITDAPPIPIRCESLQSPNPNFYSNTFNKSRSQSCSLTQQANEMTGSNYLLELERYSLSKATNALKNLEYRQYRTLGHMRIQSCNADMKSENDECPSAAAAAESANIDSRMSSSYYGQPTYSNHSITKHSNTNKSMDSIYAGEHKNINKISGDYMNPLDFKVGCQNTLRSKPIVPWYELAIRKDFKRQSCPPITTPTSIKENEVLIEGQSTDQAHVVAAFEQSLSNMTTRLQQLTATAERKDDELTDMRQTIELLRKQSIQAGLTTAHMQSMGVQTQSQSQNDLLGNKAPPPPPPLAPHQNHMRGPQQQKSSGAGGNSLVMQRHHSSDSMCSVNSISSGCSIQDKKKKKGWLRNSFSKAFSRNAKISKTSRHGDQYQNRHNASKEANSHDHHRNLSNINKPNGHCPADTQNSADLNARHESIGAVTNPECKTAKTVTLIDDAKPIDAIDHDDNTEIVEDLKKQLREKDLVLTDIRLEALSSASQLESLRETVNRMRAEMMSLKQNNARLQKLVTSKSLGGSEASLSNAVIPNSFEESKRYSLTDNSSKTPIDISKRLEEKLNEEHISSEPVFIETSSSLSPSSHIDLTSPPPTLEFNSLPKHLSAVSEDVPCATDGKKIAIACYLGQPETFAKYYKGMLDTDEFYANCYLANSDLNDDGKRKSFPTSSPNEFIIAYTYISGKTTWQNLDYVVRKTFRDYLARIDPGTNLGLNTDSISSYHLGEASRGPEMGFPSFLPCGYIVGNVKTLYICLQGVCSLAFDSLIPRNIVHRYISIITEHRRLILCGPNGTGKSYLAKRLAEFLVNRSEKCIPSEAIATFNMDHKSSKELRQYLSHIAEQTSIANRASELPSVIILDNLHHASSLGDIFSCLLSAGTSVKLPCIIGTMSQATCNTTNLQLHHNFRWILTANHMEPVKGFLGRFLRRRLFELELQTQQCQPELAAVLAWLPTVWQHINRFLEAHNSSDVTIGPRIFLSCPLDLKESQVWFTDIWNYHLSPYLIETIREGVQLYGRRGAAWCDPSDFIRNSYPWPYKNDVVPSLRQINAADVGLEGVVANTTENQDPLLKMLMSLQEAANCTNNADPESDCASIDINVTTDGSTVEE